jgi:hypothetical protein
MAELVAEVAVMVIVVAGVVTGKRKLGAVYVVDAPLAVVAGLKVPQGEPVGVVVQDQTTPPFALSLFTAATRAVWLLTATLVGTEFNVKVMGGVELLHPTRAAIVASATRRRIDLPNVIGHPRLNQSRFLLNQSWFWF